MTLAPDPSIQAWLDQEDEHTAETIRKYGTYIAYVGGGQCSCCDHLGGLPNSDAHDGPSQPPFAYTVGLFGIGHPELTIVGTDSGTASSVLNDVSARIRSGRHLVPGEILTFDRWAHRVTVESVPNPGQIAFAANRFYQRPDEYSVPLLQLTYDDKSGRFPWDAGYANPPSAQPRPGEWSA
jgi:hypothetical protein